MRIFGVILILVLSSGCESRFTNKSPDFGGQAPTKLAARIADTDNIIVTSYFAEIDKEHQDLKFSITGATVRRIVKAVSSAGRLQTQVNNIYSWVLQFNKGTNCLDSISFEGHIFGYGNEQYSDGTKVLQDLDEELARRASSSAK